MLRMLDIYRYAVFDMRLCESLDIRAQSAREICPAPPDKKLLYYPKSLTNHISPGSTCTALPAR